jgi:hypothetical protein
MANFRGNVYIFSIFSDVFKTFETGGGVSVVMLDHRNGDSTETVGLFNRSS